MLGKKLPRLWVCSANKEPSWLGRWQGILAIIFSGPKPHVSDPKLGRWWVVWITAHQTGPKPMSVIEFPKGFTESTPSVSSRSS